jgi:hypothetical protein
MNDQALYFRLGQLLTAMPAWLRMTEEDLEWLAKVQAIVNATGDSALKTEFNASVGLFMQLPSPSGERQLRLLAKRALHTLELRVPVTSAGAFIPAGNAFDAMVAVGKVLQSATQDIMIVDPYMDETVLTDFAGQAKELVALRLLSEANTCKPSLKPAVTRWISQHGSTRPLEARLTAPRVLHDRLILIDGEVAYVLTQSLKDLAARSPASLVRVSEDVAKLKVDAYEDFWSNAAAL